MKVSVIVPIYNQEKYIKECLESLVVQDIDDFEILCIDDKSSDSSVKIIKKYVNTYDNVLLLRNRTNLGAAETRNVGIKHAQGEFILFVDADDWLLSEHVLSELYQIGSDNQADLVRYAISTDKVVVNEAVTDGKELFCKEMQSWRYRWDTVRNFIKRSFLYDNHIFFRGDIYGCEDLHFSTRVLLANPRVVEIDKVLYHYNKHEGSITKSPMRSRNIHGLISTLEDFLEMYRMEKNRNVALAILQIANVVSDICKTSLWLLEENLDISEWEEETQELYRTLFSRVRYLYGSQIFEHWEKIMEATEIYIYGAGKACRELLYYTQDRVTYKGIIVSKKNKETCLNQLEIYEVDDVRIQREALILIAVTGSAQNEIKEILRKNGYDNVISLGIE